LIDDPVVDLVPQECRYDLVRPDEGYLVEVVQVESGKQELVEAPARRLHGWPSAIQIIRQVYG
jgi:hypothetical protein